MSQTINPPAATAPASTPTNRWSVAALVTGALALLVAATLFASSATLILARHSMPDNDGFFMTPHMRYAATSYALTTESVDLDAGGMGGMMPHSVLGDARITISSVDARTPLFIGVGPTADVENYLRDVERTTLVTMRMTNGQNAPIYREATGRAPATRPGAQAFWADRSQGSGPQTIAFPIRTGSWTVVVMRADGERGMSTDVTAGATLPAISWVVGILLVGTVAFLVIGLTLVISGVRSQRPRLEPVSRSAVPPRSPPAE